MGLVLRGNMSLFLRLDVLIKHLGKDQLALERAGAYNIGIFFFGIDMTIHEDSQKEHKEFKKREDKVLSINNMSRLWLRG